MLLRGIEEYQESNERLGADISDQSGVIKTLLIRAEDARLIGDMYGNFFKDKSLENVIINLYTVILNLILALKCYIKLFIFLEKE